MTYRITDAPLPITAYRSTIKVTPAKNGGSTVTWSSSVRGKSDHPKHHEKGEDDESLKSLVKGVYRAGLDNL